MENEAIIKDSLSPTSSNEQYRRGIADSFQQVHDAETTVDSPININNDDCNANKNQTRTFSSASDYQSKKPKWWKRIAGRRGTPGQRKAISRMTEKGYVLSSSKLLVGKYRQQLDISNLFAHRPNGNPIVIEDILIPHENAHDSKDYQSSKLDDCKCHADNDPYVCLEIGFGQGDVLLANASKFPNRYYIGSEIHQPGIGNVLLRMENDINQEMSISSSLTLQQQHDEKRTHQPYDNVRIYPGDGVKLLGILPSISLNAVYLTFPDPWPKDDDHGWRVIQVESVHAIGRVLKHGGCFYLATDSECFYDWTMDIFQKVQINAKNCGEVEAPLRARNGAVSWEQVVPCPDRGDWLPVVSKYEEKGIAEGRHTMLQCWRKV